MPPDITDTELQQLVDQKLSQNEIARRTGIARSTIRRRIERLSTPVVDEIIIAWKEMQEMLEWWRSRKRALQTADDTEQENQRQTYHVQKRYIDAIKRAADLERVS